MTEENQPSWICGFWRRIGALMIDFVVLGIFGLLLGLFLERYFIEIGVWGRFIGFSIALVYFGVMNSQITNGQTLGKKVLKIRVVGSDNRSINVAKSVARYCVIGIPFFLNGAQFPMDVMYSAWLNLLSLIIFGCLLSIVYLYIFNRTTRQSLHDLVVGTYVVNAEAEISAIGNIWRPHLAIVGLIFITAGIVPMFTSNLAQQEPFSDLLKSHELLMNNPLVKYATVSYGKSTMNTQKTGKTETTYASAQVFLEENQISNAELGRELAKVLVLGYQQAFEKDVIVVNLIYGYDIGIASKWSSYSHRFNPNEFDRN